MAAESVQVNASVLQQSPRSAFLHYAERKLGITMYNLVPPGLANTNPTRAWLTTLII